MKKIILIYTLVSLAAAASAQTEKQLVPSDLKQLTIVTEPATLYKGFFRAGMSYSYSAIDKIFDSEAKKTYLPYNIWGSASWYSVFLEYGITDRLMVDVDIEFTNTLRVSYNRVLYPELNINRVFSASNRGRGLGDCGLVVKYQIIPERENKSSLTGNLTLTVPTGKKNPTNIISATEYDLPTGDGYLSTLFELRYKKISYPFSWSGYASYEHKFKGSILLNATDVTETVIKDGDGINCGALLSFHLNEWIALKNNIDFLRLGKSVKEGKPEYDIDPQWLLSYQSLLVFQVKQFRIGEGIMIPIKGKSTGSDPMLILLTQYIF